MGRTSDAKERLLKSAIDLIYSRSYAGVSVQDICEHADVKKGSFHYFFKTKRDLALAALEQQWDLLNKTVLERSLTNISGWSKIVAAKCMVVILVIWRSN
ncbi:MAG: TetR/AcrR family transcriptional regulator [Nitrospirae bacterium]|nr:TetR/AcrR family transcriptional regulator [Nitrospirota bacterium]